MATDRKFTLVEMSGYVGERDATGWPSIHAAIKHRAETYDADELDPESPNCLHVGIRMDWTDEAGEQHSEYVG